MGTDHMPGPSRLLRIREVLQLCGMSRTTLYREIKLHNFPAPIKLSARSVGKPRRCEGSCYCGPESVTARRGMTSASMRKLRPKCSKLMQWGLCYHVITL